MGLSAVHTNSNKFVNDHLSEIKANSGVEQLAPKRIIYSWLSSWSEDAYESWAKNPTTDYI